MGIPSLVIFGVGAILIYSAIKNKNPLDVLKQSLGQSGAPGDFGQPTIPGNDFHTSGAEVGDGNTIVPASYVPSV